MGELGNVGDKYKAPWYVNDWLLLILFIGSFFIGYYGLIILGYIVVVLPKKRKDEEEFYKKKREYEMRRIIRKAREDARNIERQAHDESRGILQKAEKDREEIWQYTREVIEELKGEIIECKEEIEKYEEEIGENEEELDKLENGIHEAKKGKILAEERKKEADRLARKAESTLEGLRSYIRGINRLMKELPGVIEGEELRERIREYSGYYEDTIGLDTTVGINLSYMSESQLAQRMTATQRELDRVYSRYNSEFTRNGNWELYVSIMLGLKAEVLLLLTKLKGEGYDEGIEDLKRITDKYLKIAVKSEENDIGMIANFIFEVEPLLVNMVEIEKSAKKV